MVHFDNHNNSQQDILVSENTFTLCYLKLDNTEKKKEIFSKVY